jgi:hypothetical protein
VAKNRENKKKRLKKAREADRKEKKAKKETVLRLHAATALEIEAAKEQDKILKNTKITRSAITIDNEDEKICHFFRPRRQHSVIARNTRAPILSTIERSLN